MNSFVSKYWKNFQFVNLFFAFLSNILIFFLPESPRFYFSKNDFDKTKETFTKIGRINGILKEEDTFTFTFVEETKGKKLDSETSTFNDQ